MPFGSKNSAKICFFHFISESSKFECFVSPAMVGQADQRDGIWLNSHRTRMSTLTSLFGKLWCPNKRIDWLSDRGSNRDLASWQFPKTLKHPITQSKQSSLLFPYVKVIWMTDEAVLSSLTDESKSKQIQPSSNSAFSNHNTRDDNLRCSAMPCEAKRSEAVRRNATWRTGQDRSSWTKQLRSVDALQSRRALSFSNKAKLNFKVECHPFLGLNQISV
jgi:hypothetical protein